MTSVQCPECRRMFHDAEELQRHHEEHHPAVPSPAKRLRERFLVTADASASPAFAERKNCYSCGKRFRIALPRHHCRSCGRSVCGPHSRNFAALPHIGYTNAVRCCDACFGQVLRDRGGRSRRPGTLASERPSTTLRQASAASEGGGSEGVVLEGPMLRVFPSRLVTYCVLGFLSLHIFRPKEHVQGQEDAEIEPGRLLATVHLADVISVQRRSGEGETGGLVLDVELGDASGALTVLRARTEEECALWVRLVAAAKHALLDAVRSLSTGTRPPPPTLAFALAHDEAGAGSGGVVGRRELVVGRGVPYGASFTLPWLLRGRSGGSRARLYVDAAACGAISSGAAGLWAVSIAASDISSAARAARAAEDDGAPPPLLWVDVKPSRRTSLSTGEAEVLKLGLRATAASGYVLRAGSFGALRARLGHSGGGINEAFALAHSEGQAHGGGAVDRLSSTVEWCVAREAALDEALEGLLRKAGLLSATRDARAAVSVLLIARGAWRGGEGTVANALAGALCFVLGLAVFVTALWTSGAADGDTVLEKLRLAVVDYAWEAIEKPTGRRRAKDDSGAAAARRSKSRERLERATATSSIVDAPPDLPLRFVRMTRGDISLARKAWDTTVRWRTDFDVPNEVHRPQPHFEAIKRLFPHFVHKTDKNGCLVYYEIMDSPNAAFTAARQLGAGPDDLVAHMRFFFEFLYAELCVDPDVPGVAPKPTGSVMKIIDLRNVGLRDCCGDSLAYFGKLSKVGANFPERMYRIVIVNAPATFGMVWRVVSPRLDRNVRERISVVSGDYAPTLLKFIDAENLPKAYGGTCECPGGCECGSEHELRLRERVKLNADKAAVHHVAAEGDEGGTETE